MMSAMQNIGELLGNQFRKQFGSICVATIAERDSLPAECRTESMAVHVLNNGDGAPEFYVLGAGLTNIDWVAVTDGYALGGSPEAITLEPEVLPSYPGQWSIGARLPGPIGKAGMSGSTTHSIMAGGHTSHYWNNITWNNLGANAYHPGTTSALRCYHDYPALVGTEISGAQWGGAHWNSYYDYSMDILINGIWYLGPLTVYNIVYGGAAGVGTVNNALSLGGRTTPSSDENKMQSYNGSVWSASGTLPHYSAFCKASGTTSSLLMVGSNSTGAHDEVYTYNGTSFTAVASLLVERVYGVLGGVVGSATYSTGSSSDDVYSFDGVTWSTSNPAPATANTAAGCGTSSSIMQTGGYTATTPEAPEGEVQDTWFFSL